MKGMTTREQHFDDLFETNADPWGYADLWDEQRRHALMLTMLDSPRYRRTFEPGCASGVFTAGLAERSDELVAWDWSQNAVELARRRVVAHPNVEVVHGSVPDAWPDSQFDLIVLSDFLYYLTSEAIEHVASRVSQSLDSGGLLMTCHWRGVAHDFSTAGGDEVHRLLRSLFGKPTAFAYRDSRQLIEGWKV